jgi:diguanylate cyclase (GGDEF)-like protein/PAS domain S-box-containing protein
MVPTGGTVSYAQIARQRLCAVTWPPALRGVFLLRTGVISQPDTLFEADAIPGALSAAAIGHLTDQTLGANISVVDRNFRLLYANAHYAKSCATTQEKLIGLSLFDLHGEAQMRELEPYFQRVHAGEEVTYVRLSRIGVLDSVWVTVSLSPWRDETGQVKGSVLVSMRVHELKVNAEALRAANERLTSHIDNSPLAMLELDKNLTVAGCSAQFRNLIGLDDATLIGAPILDLLAAGEATQPLAQAFARLQTGIETRNRVELALRHHSGVTVHSEWFNSALTDARGKLSSIMSLVQDTTARTLAEAQLRENAMRDPLTGLANRRALTDRIERAVQRCASHLALLLVDLDGFKPINDAHGHGVGDEVLCEVGRRLCGLAPGTATVARVGGDEFVLLVEGEFTSEVLANLGARIMQAIEAPYFLGRAVLRVSASIGVAQCPPAATNAVELMRQADAAMYEAKRAGKARVNIAPGQVTIR